VSTVRIYWRNFPLSYNGCLGENRRQRIFEGSGLVGVMRVIPTYTWIQLRGTPAELDSGSNQPEFSYIILTAVTVVLAVLAIWSHFSRYGDMPASKARRAPLRSGREGDH